MPKMPTALEQDSCQGQAWLLCQCVKVKELLSCSSPSCHEGGLLATDQHPKLCTSLFTSAQHNHPPVTHIMTASFQGMQSCFMLCIGLRGPQPDTNAKMLHASTAARMCARI
jgi:hypothetical protein